MIKWGLADFLKDNLYHNINLINSKFENAINVLLIEVFGSQEWHLKSQERLFKKDVYAGFLEGILDMWQVSHAFKSVGPVLMSLFRECIWCALWKGGRRLKK